VVGCGRDEAGKARYGCLISALLLAFGVYVGIQFFEVYFRYYQIQDEVRTQAQFAPSLTDDVIRRRLVARSDTLGLPLGPRQWEVRRSFNPREMTIRAEYEDSVVIEVLFIRKVFRFRFTPSARIGL
jgi:hypothetical protein